MLVDDRRWIGHNFRVRCNGNADVPQTFEHLSDEESIDDDAILSATLRAMEAGMHPDRNVPIAPGNLLRDGQGIAYVRLEMLADYALGRDDLTSSDILCALTCPIDRCDSSNPRDSPRVLQECQSSSQAHPHQPYQS